MFDKEIAALIEAFGERQRLFDKDRQADAREFIEDQVNLWELVLAWIGEGLQPSDDNSRKILRETTIGDGLQPSDDKLHNIPREITRAIYQNKHQLFRLELVSDSLQVSSDLPLLNEESLHKFGALRFKGRHVYMLLAALIIEAGGVFQNLLSKQDSDDSKTSNLSLNPLMTAQVIQYMCLYASQRFVSKQPDFKSLADLRTQVEAYLSNAQERDTKRMNDWVSFQTEKQNELAKLKESLEEKIALKAAVKVWSAKISGHSTTFYVSFGLLVVVTVLLLVAIFCWRHEISTFLHSLAPEGGDLRYGFLVLTLIPVLAIGWLLRIGGKVATQALTLKADAEQRSAMVSTYLSLIADPNAGVDKSDRSIVLNALFRPLPGESEDISPPSFVELLLKDRSKKE
jgi:hypothetical protein